MPKIKVHVVKSGQDFFVQPAIVAVEKNDQLRIINATEESLVFHVKDTAILKTDTDQTKVVAKNDRVTIDLTGNTLTDGKQFEYQIFMLESGKKAKGNSDPVLIIDN